MLIYDLKIAFKSLRRTPILSLLLISGIALGICVSTAFITLRHMYTREPIPGKSDRVFYVRLDSWGKDKPFKSEDRSFASNASIPDQVTYRDARGLLRSPIPKRQTPTYITHQFVFPDPKVARPYRADVRLVFGDFFEMFNTPFRYGGRWSRQADAKPEQVVIIDDATNHRLFGGADSVGRTVRLDEREFRVVGVLAPWRPALRIFDLTRDPAGPPEAIYIPFNFCEPLGLWSFGNKTGWKREKIKSFADYRGSEQVWIQYWVELGDRSDVAAYGDWLRGYILDQKKLGRFERPVYYKLSTIPELIVEWRMMPSGVEAMSIVSLLFLVVCSFNLVGMLLGKFLTRMPEVSVRRALGASRGQVFRQHLVECEVIGVIGGLAGVLLSFVILGLLARFLQNGEALRFDGEMALTATFLSLAAGLLSGAYPAWRVSTTTSALQLKVQ